MKYTDTAMKHSMLGAPQSWAELLGKCCLVHSRLIVRVLLPPR
jgi:hypothetical protein